MTVDGVFPEACAEAVQSALLGVGGWEDGRMGGMAAVAASSGVCGWRASTHAMKPMLSARAAHQFWIARFTGQRA